MVERCNDWKTYSFGGSWREIQELVHQRNLKFITVRMDLPANAVPQTPSAIAKGILSPCLALYSSSLLTRESFSCAPKEK